MKININNIPDKYKGIIKEDMTRDEIMQLGQIIMKEKKEKFKMWIYGVFHGKKTKNENNKKIQ